jgi:hypothetical protein
MEMLAPELRNDILRGKQKVEKKVIQQIAKDGNIAEPISDLSTLVVDSPSVAMNVVSSDDLKELSSQIFKASEKYASTQSQQDLETLSKLVNVALKLY